MTMRKHISKLESITKRLAYPGKQYCAPCRRNIILCENDDQTLQNGSDLEFQEHLGQDVTTE